MLVAPFVAWAPLVAVPLSAAVLPAVGLLAAPAGDPVLLALGLIPVDAAEPLPPTWPVT